MIVSSDIDYIEAEKIKRGEEKMNPDFNNFALWIEKRFDISKILNITCENKITADTNKKFSLLKIYIELEFDKKKLDRYFGEGCDSYDKEITESFRKLVNNKYYKKDIGVSYYGFEHIAKGKANESIPKIKINKLIKSFRNNDFWTIHRLFETTIFFVQTEKQVQKYRDSSLFNEWTDLYLELLKEYDEFDYFNRDNFKIKIDSKENFEKRYDGKWFYYDR